MTWAEEKKLFALVAWRNRQHRGEEDWEDILSESLLVAWERYRKAGDLPPDRAMALAVGCSRLGYAMWCRRWHGDSRNQVNQRDGDLSLDVLGDLPVPDFSAAVIARVDGARLWEQVQAVCAPRQRQVMERVIIHGEGIDTVGRHLGIHANAAWQSYRNAIRKCQKALGVP